MFEALKSKVEEILNTPKTAEEKMLDICQALQDAVVYYDWVGFYFKNGDNAN